MSYEYKDTIQDSVIDYYDHVLLCNEYTDKILDELDQVYSQATKADEYEAKAKAFDRIVKESKGAFSCGDFCDDVRHIINNYEIGVARDD